MKRRPGTADKLERVGVIGAGNWANYGHLPSMTLLPEYFTGFFVFLPVKEYQKKANFRCVVR